MSDINLFNLEPLTYKISDFLSWYKSWKLILSPDFQRRLVWSVNYQSYLIDTIIRWLPIPIIIIRDQIISLDDYEPKREVIDWQQRLNTIISFVLKWDFKIKKSHNELFWNMYFKDLPTDIQQRILNYKFSIYELPTEITDVQVLEIFSRLNSTWYKLNRQELRNAQYDWEFKNSVYSISSKCIDYFLDWGLFNLNEISRMKEAELTTDIYIYMLEWLRERKPDLFDKYYSKYDDSFPKWDIIELKYIFIMNSINELLWEDIKNTVYSKDSMFYHLYIIFYDYYYWTDIENIEILNKSIPSNWKNKLLKISNKIENNDISAEIIKAFSLWTNNIDARKKKYNFLNEIMYG